MKVYMSSILLLGTFLIKAALVTCSIQNITYKVIYNSIGSNMGVLVDNNAAPFMLQASLDSPYIYTGIAPIATTGYRYTRVSNGNSSESESFSRSPSQKDTSNEFYDRSINSYTLPEYPQLYPPLSAIHKVSSYLHQDDQIPTIFFEGNEAEIANMHSHVFDKTIKVEMSLTYIGLNQVKSFQGIKIKIAGRGTRFSTKASYKINFDKEDNDLLGFQKVKLRSLITDPSYIREKISYDLAKSFGLTTSGYSFARVFINSKPYGLFGIQEDFEDPWLVNEFNNGVKEGFSQGTLYSGSISASLAYLGDNETLYTAPGNNFFNESSYEIKETPSNNGEKAAASFDNLIAFTKFLNSAPTTQSDAVAIWNEHIDTDSVLRSMALEIILGNSDGYIGGPSNYYLYLDPSQHDRLIYISSDMDMTLGSSATFPVNETITGGYETYAGYNETLPLIHNILKVPDFKVKFETIINNVIGQQINRSEFLFNRIDALSVMIKEDVEWDMSIPRDYISLPILNLKNNNITSLLIKKGQTYFLDYLDRIEHKNISFEQAVNGTLSRPTIMGLKEWISKSTSAYLQVNPSLISHTRNTQQTSNAIILSAFYDRIIFKFIAILSSHCIIYFFITLV